MRGGRVAYLAAIDCLQEQVELVEAALVEFEDGDALSVKLNKPNENTQ